MPMTIRAKLLTKAVWGLLGLVGLWMCAGWGLALYCRLMTKSLPPVDDSDMYIEIPQVPDVENAAAAFLAMTNLIQYTESDRRSLADCQMVNNEDASLRQTATKDQMEKCRHAVDRVLGEHAKGLAELHRLAALPQYQLKFDAASKDRPPIASMAWANMLWNLQSIRARERGELQSAFSSDCDSLKFFTRCRDNASGSVEMLAGCGLLRIVHQRLIRLAAAEGVSADLQAALADLLRDDFDEQKTFEQMMKREYVRSCRSELHEVETSHLGNRFLLLPKIPGMTVVRGFMALPGFSGSFWRFAYNPELTRKNFASVCRACLTGKDSKEELEVLVPAPKSVFTPNWWGASVARELTPASGDLRRTLKYSSFSCRAARVAIAVQRYRRAHGSKYPADLSELVPAFLDKVPQDPFAPARKLSYAPDREIVWTVGPDGDFDPLAEKVGTLSLSDRKMSKNAIRLDGKNHDPRPPRNLGRKSPRDK